MRSRHFFHHRCVCPHPPICLFDGGPRPRTDCSATAKQTASHNHTHKLTHESNCCLEAACCCLLSVVVCCCCCRLAGCCCCCVPPSHNHTTSTPRPRENNRKESKQGRPHKRVCERPHRIQSERERAVPQISRCTDGPSPTQHRPIDRSIVHRSVVRSPGRVLLFEPCAYTKRRKEKSKPRRPHHTRRHNKGRQQQPDTTQTNNNNKASAVVCCCACCCLSSKSPQDIVQRT